MQLEHRLSALLQLHLHSEPTFNGCGKGNCKMRRETFKFVDLVHLILETWRYVTDLMTVSQSILSSGNCLSIGTKSFWRIWAEPSWRRISQESSSRFRKRISSFTVSVKNQHNSMSLLRADSRFAPSQWEMVLLCNNVSHWLGASLYIFCKEAT